MGKSNTPLSITLDGKQYGITQLYEMLSPPRKRNFMHRLVKKAMEKKFTTIKQLKDLMEDALKGKSIRCNEGEYRYTKALNALIPEAVKVADSEVPKLKNDRDRARWNKFYSRAMTRMAVKEGLRCV